MMQPERTQNCDSFEPDMDVSLGVEITGADPFVCNEQWVKRRESKVRAEGSQVSTKAQSKDKRAFGGRVSEGSNP